MTALTISRDDHSRFDAQSRVVVAGPASGSGHCAQEAQTSSAAAGSDLPVGQQNFDAQGSSAGGDPFLALAADVLDDTEQNRQANENRLRQLTRAEADADGEERGFGLDLGHPAVAQLAGLVQMMKCDSKPVLALGLPKPKKVRGVPCCFEHTAEANLQQMLRAHPLWPWIKAQKGIGPKQGARLLAAIGDPYLGPDGTPRTVSQLWAYCGHGDPTRKRRKGMSQDDLFALGNPVAKSRVWLISCAVLKTGGGEEKAMATPRTIAHPPSLAAVYYHRKNATIGREHATACVRCGPSGKPAPAGSPWSDAHRHADALRVTGKAILRNLWVEAKRIHEAAS